MYIKTMSSQASSPASPASITEEISTRTISDVVKDFNMEELIEYLKKKNLKLEESHFEGFNCISPVLCGTDVKKCKFLDNLCVLITD